MSSTIGHFSIRGDFEPSEITEKLGLQPSSVTPKGTLFEGAEFASKSADWDLYCPNDQKMSEQVAFLLELLWPRREAI